MSTPRPKAAGEAGVLEHMPDAMILRPSIIFGAEDQFFNRFAGMSRMGPVLPVYRCRYYGSSLSMLMMLLRLPLLRWAMPPIREFMNWVDLMFRLSAA